MEWREVTGSVRPLELDKVSSPTTVYFRKNIRQETRDIDGEPHLFWVYDECSMSRTDYAIYVAETAESKADYIAMMADIDMEVA